jgi:hypothetical protein
MPWPMTGTSKIGVILGHCIDPFERFHLTIKKSKLTPLLFLSNPDGVDPLDHLVQHW